MAANPNPKILNEKDATEKELDKYFKTFFLAVDSLKFKLPPVGERESTNKEIEKYGRRVAQLQALYGKDFYDLVIQVYGLGRADPNGTSTAQIIGKDFYTLNLFRVRAASLGLDNNNALISVPPDKLDRSKNILASDRYPEGSAVPYYDLSGPGSPRLR